MKDFHIETIQIDGRDPYLKVYFEDVVDKNLIHTWLNLPGYLKKVNVNEDDNCKVYAIVQLFSDSNVQEVRDKLTVALERI